MSTTKVKKNSKALNAEIENALFNDVERWEMFFTSHWKQTLAAAVAVVLAVTAAFALYHRSVKAKRAAAEQLGAADTAAELQSAIAKYPDAPGAALARYRLALRLIEEKKYDQAVPELSKAAASGDAALRDKAKLTEAYALELSGKLADAAVKFTALGTSGSSNAPVKCEALYSAGRLYVKLGKKAEARAVLKNAAGVALPNGSESAAYWKASAAELLNSIE